jgi:hypothetical protein
VRHGRAFLHTTEIFDTISHMTAQIVQKNKSLLEAFRKFKKRYLSVGKKPDVRKLLPNDLYHTMRLEGEKVTRKQVQVLFK